MLRGSGKSQDVSFSFFPGSSGERQPSEVNYECSESNTFAKVVLQTVQINPMWQKDARENLRLTKFTVTSFSFVALLRPSPKRRIALFFDVKTRFCIAKE